MFTSARATGCSAQRVLENLEGGIDYLRKVVCEDSLASAPSWKPT